MRFRANKSPEYSRTNNPSKQNVTRLSKRHRIPQCRYFKKLVSNYIGCDVDLSITLTMVTVMLGLDAMKVFVR